MNNFKFDNPCALSFSGGRTSGYMLWKTLEFYNGVLPDHVHVVFANTGKEMPETLDFVRDCGEQWGVDIVWLECEARIGEKNAGENKYVYDTKQVTYETASRKGEPFEKLIIARNYLPNPVARFCTQELKVLRIRDFMNTIYEKSGNWDNVVGIRADEPKRAPARLKAGDLIPLYMEGTTKEIVGEFWDNQDFDLQLPGRKGVTDLGNCDLCFLKGFSKKQSIVRDHDGLVDWWIRMEELVGATFRTDQPSYKQMTANYSIFDDEDLGDCFCGD